MLSKTCIKCKVVYELSIDNFHANEKSSDGFRHSCRHCKSLYDRNRYLTKRELILHRSKNWYLQNKNQKSQYDANRRKTQAIEIAEAKKLYAAQYIKKFPYRTIANRLNRRNREFKTTKQFRFCEQDIKHLLHQFRMRCFSCDQKFSNLQELEIDHVIPKKRGGSNSIGNIVPLCKDCNRQKSYRLWIEYRLGKIVPLSKL